MILQIEFLIVLHFIYQIYAKSYEGYRLITCNPRSIAEVNFLLTLEKNYGVSFWREPTKPHFPVEFIVSPKKIQLLKQGASIIDIKLKVISTNIQGIIANETILTSHTVNPETFDWKRFNTLQSIYRWLYHLEFRHPGVLKVAVIGKTKELRDILAVKVKFQEVVRSTVVIDGGLHAREWIATSFVTYMIHELLHFRHSKNKWLVTVAQLYEWYFVPIANPDGYVYTFTNDRLWRKNRNGPGVDLNRNYQPYFGVFDASADVDSEKYPGPEAFSENETQALKMFFEERKAKLEYYFSIHSYGQLIVIPYGYSEKHLDNYRQAYALASKTAYQLKKHGVTYTIGNPSECYNRLISGTSADWVKSYLRVPYVYTFELDSSAFGFLTSADRIMSICKETSASIAYMLMNPSRSFQKLPDVLVPLRQEFSSATGITANQYLSFSCLFVTFISLYNTFYVYSSTQS